MIYSANFCIVTHCKKRRFTKNTAIFSAASSTPPVDPLKLDLLPLYKEINKGLNPPPYNIYITDRSYVIKNSTYKKDIGFDLSFAKEIFEKHFRENRIGVSTPLLEKSSKKFFSYSDSYYRYNDDPKYGVLQLSYTYANVDARLHHLWQLIAQEKDIKSVKAYTQLNDGFIIDIKLGDFKSYKPELDEILKKEKEGRSIAELLKKKGFKKVEHEDVIYYFFSATSPIDPSISILYYIEFSKAKLQKELASFYKMALLTTLLGLFIIYMLFRLYQKEQRFSSQDMFVQSSMHQLKTPLSIIRINNEILQMQHPNNPYSKNIEAGIRTLQNSFEDMHFFLKEEKEFKQEELSLQKRLQERIDYFDTIAKAYDKEILCICKNDIRVEMSYEELVRLIDNNLSNALKYSQPYSKVEISLQNSTLSFRTKSKPIKEKRRIFEKYYREDNTQGGHRLGLFIVKSITKKYDIAIHIDSKEGYTTFSYIFPSKGEL